MGILQGLCVGPGVDANGNFEEKLWAMWKEETGNQTLFYAYYDGNEWSGQQSLPSPIGSSVGPSLAYDGSIQTLHFAWKGSYCDEALYRGAHSPDEWSSQFSINVPQGSSTGPALAVSNSYGTEESLYAMWKGPSCDQGLYWAYLDYSSGWEWYKISLSNALSSVGPSLAVGPDGIIYAAWKGPTGDEGLWGSYLQDNFTWATPEPFYKPNEFPNFPHPIGSSVGPSLAVLNGTLYAAWKGVTGDPGLYWAECSTYDWLEPQQFFPSVASSTGPALAVYQGILYAMWKGPAGDQGLYWASQDDRGNWQSTGSVGGNTGQDVMPC